MATETTLWDINDKRPEKTIYVPEGTENEQIISTLMHGYGFSKLQEAAYGVRETFKKYKLVALDKDGSLEPTYGHLSEFDEIIAKFPNLAEEDLEKAKEILNQMKDKNAEFAKTYVAIIKQNIDSILRQDREPERGKETERG